MGFAGDALQMSEGVADVEGGIGGMVVNGRGCGIQPNDQPADKQDKEEYPSGEAFESGHASNIIKKIGPDLSVNSLLNIVDRVSVGAGRGWLAAPEALAVSGLVLFWGALWSK